MNFGATNQCAIDAIFGNRNGFGYLYSLRGAPVTSYATLAAYPSTDPNNAGGVDIFISFAANVWGTASYTVLENEQETVYSPAVQGAVPTSTPLFDASNPSYPPVSYQDFSGNTKIGGNLTLPGTGASITFPDSTVQQTAWNGTTLGGDYAEAVNVLGDRSNYEPGDLIVIDASKDGAFNKSSTPYSKLVAGVYSTKPGLTGRRTTASRLDKEAEIPMAMMGIVPTKVTAENGPINRGDLLVSSDIPGYAMKATDANRLLGAVIGKALAPLQTGKGLIEVLVSLQ